jgi:hypothetical protein
MLPSPAMRVAAAAVVIAVSAGASRAQTSPAVPATPAQPARTLGGTVEPDVPPWRQPSSTASAPGASTGGANGTPNTRTSNPSKPAEIDPVTGPAKRGRAYNVKPLKDLQARPRS